MDGQIMSVKIDLRSDDWMRRCASIRSMISDPIRYAVLLPDLYRIYRTDKPPPSSYARSAFGRYGEEAVPFLLGLPRNLNQLSLKRVSGVPVLRAFSKCSSSVAEHSVVGQAGHGVSGDISGPDPTYIRHWLRRPLNAPQHMISPGFHVRR